jgi:subfamily B ATP-binding cassette protein MsbA
VAESLAGVRIAKTYGLEGYLKGKAAGGLRRGAPAQGQGRQPARPARSAAGGGGGMVTVALVLVFIGWRISNGQSTIGDFTGYVTACCSRPSRCARSAISTPSCRRRWRR